MKSASSNPGHLYPAQVVYFSEIDTQVRSNLYITDTLIYWYANSRTLLPWG